MFTAKTAVDLKAQLQEGANGTVSIYQDDSFTAEATGNVAAGNKIVVQKGDLFAYYTVTEPKLTITQRETVKNHRPILRLMAQLDKTNAADGTPRGNELQYIDKRMTQLLEDTEEQSRKLVIHNLVLRDAVFSRFLQNEPLSDISMEELLESVGISFTEPYFAVVMIYIDDVKDLFFEEATEDMMADNYQLARLIISNILSDVLPPELHCAFCSLNGAFCGIVNTVRKEGSGDKIKQALLQHIFEVNLHQARPQIQTAKCLVYDVMGCVMKVLNDIGDLDGNNVFEQFKVFERIDRCKTVLSIQKELTDIFKKICENSMNESVEKMHRLIEGVKTFVGSYYDDPNLSCEVISDLLK